MERVELEPRTLELLRIHLESGKVLNMSVSGPAAESS